MQSSVTSTSGLAASQAWLDRISNNLANMETPGFAMQTQSFAEAYTQALNGTATGGTAAGRFTPPGWWGGNGVLPTTGANDFATMPLNATGVSTDLAIQGNAFFLVGQPDGSTALTKDGHFHFSPVASGPSVGAGSGAGTGIASSKTGTSASTQSMELGTSAGNPVLDVNGKPIYATPAQAATMSVAANGQISWGSTGNASVAAPRIAMATVPSPDNTLIATGNNLYTPTSGTTAAVVNGFATSGIGSGQSMVQGSLAGSNVDLTDEMTQMIEAQRMFELNTEALQLTDQMKQTAATIKT